MAAVGFDLYTRMLAEAVEEEKAAVRAIDPRAPEGVDGHRPARRRLPAGRLRARGAPEARALPAAGAGRDRGGARRRPGGAARPVRAAAGARRAAAGGGAAAHHGRGAGHPVGRPRGRPAGAALRSGLVRRRRPGRWRRVRPTIRCGRSRAASPTARTSCGSGSPRIPIARGGSRASSWNGSPRG